MVQHTKTLYPYFPHETFRKGQKEMFEFIKENLEKGIISFVHAPTGIGKTASALGAAMKFAEENHLKVFFLTNRHEHHRIVFKTVRKINEKYNKNFKAINILNKKSLCNQKIEKINMEDFHDYCKTLRKDHLCYFYENTIRNGSLTSQARIALAKYKDAIITESEKIKENLSDFCPYEMILELLKDSNVIIADYYYLFHPSISNTFLGKLNLKLEDIVVIVDEAHNLPDRIRRMNDIKLSSYILKRAIKESREHYPEIAKILLNIGMNIEALLLNKIKKEDSQAYLTKEEIMSIIEKEISYQSLLDFLYDIAEKVYRNNNRSYANSIRKFLEFWEDEMESIVRIGEINKNDNISWNIRIIDMDVSSKIYDIISQVKGAIFMSATLYPLNMYQDITGLKHISKALELTSPFPIENQKVYIIKGVTTKYEYRDENTFKIYGEIISIIANNFKNNIIFFFPSYETRDHILPYLSFEPRKIILMEKKDITKSEKDKILETMRKNNDVVLLAISGANFYEGVDFKEKTAEIVGIIGIPFEKPDLYAKSIISYYEKMYGKGKEYGYIIPTINKVIQSAGRIIRSEKEKGIIFFIDNRYTYPAYLSYIKTRYNNIAVIHHSELIREIIMLNNFLNKSINEEIKPSD